MDQPQTKPHRPDADVPSTLPPATPDQLQYIHLTSETPSDSKELADAARLFKSYHVHYKWVHELEKCHAWLVKRLATGAHVFLCYYTPSSDNSADPDSADTAKPTAIPVGFCQVYPSYGSIALEENWLLNDLYVDQHYRSLKIGQGFLKHIIQWADDSGAYKLHIQTTLHNPRAQYLYPKLGWVETSRGGDTISYTMSFERSKTQPYQSYYE